ncbi:MAG: GNAT family N-acetyltransferase [Chitinophagales bacterium]
MQTIHVVIAENHHALYAPAICKMIAESAAQRGTGIAKRSPEEIAAKIEAGKAVIALCGEELVGFCYIQEWQEGEFSSNSALIVHPHYRSRGIAKAIKEKAFELARQKFPNAKLFGLTTSLPVMKINSELGYKPVTFNLIPSDDQFWEGCKGCVNHDILIRMNRKHCLCNALLFDPEKEEQKKLEEEIKNHLEFFKQTTEQKKTEPLLVS